MTDVYWAVFRTVEKSKQEVPDSFKDSNRFDERSEQYEGCYYIAKEIYNEDDTYVICIDIYDINDKPFERYEIKNFSDKVNVSVYEIEGKKPIRTILDAKVIASSINNFFNSILKFMSSAKEQDDKTTLRFMNDYYESKEHDDGLKLRLMNDYYEYKELDDETTLHLMNDYYELKFVLELR